TAAEYAPARVTRSTCQRPPAQRAVYMNMTVGKHFRALTDGRSDHQVATAGVDLLPGAHRLRYHPGRRLAGRIVVMFRRRSMVTLALLALAAVITRRLAVLTRAVNSGTTAGG